MEFLKSFVPWVWILNGKIKEDPFRLQYSTVQYSTIQCSTVQYSTVQCSTVQYSTVQYSAVQYSTVQYSTVQYSTVQYSTVQYSTVQYSTVQYGEAIYPTPHQPFIECNYIRLFIRYRIDYKKIYASAFFIISFNIICVILWSLVIFYDVMWKFYISKVFSLLSSPHEYRNSLPWALREVHLLHCPKNI